MLKKPVNPFYVLLVIVGVAFAITACAYGLMSFRESHLSPVELLAERQHPLSLLMNRYGMGLILGELVVLGLCTVGVIATDQYWADRTPRAGAGPQEESDSAKEELLK